MQEFLVKVRKFALKQADTTGVPSKTQVEFTKRIAIRLAKNIGAKPDIVEAGTLLMDSMLGEALKENRTNEHTKMALEKVNEFFAESTLSEEEKENIRHCILEHHGVENFYSPESEICCNADCYKFASIKGFLISYRYTRHIPVEDLIKLLTDKFYEKKHAVSLSIVKTELLAQYVIIEEIIRELSKNN